MTTPDYASGHEYAYWTGRLSATLDLVLRGVTSEERARSTLEEYQQWSLAALDKLAPSEDHNDDVEGYSRDFEPPGNSALHPSQRP